MTIAKINGSPRDRSFEILGKMIKLALVNKLDALYCNVSLTIKNKK